MNGIYYARPSDNLTASATVSLSAGAAAAAFPITNAYDLNPAKPFKATTGTCTIRLVFGAAQALQAIALIRAYLAGATVTVTNNAGLSVAMPFEAVAEDGLPVDPFLDLRNVAVTPATQWEIAIVGASAAVEIGEVLALETLRDMEVGRTLQRGDRIPIKENVTAFGVRLVYPLGVRLHRLTATTILEELREDLLALWRDALGPTRGFLVIPDLNVNEAFYMRFAADDFPWAHQTDEMTDMAIALEEVGRGPGR